MKILFLLLCVSIIICGQAQQKQLSLDKLTVENGLPDNYPRTFVQDNKGYMWIGTFSGLVRYDGYNIKTYTLGKDVAKEYYYNVINCLFVDHEGVVWVDAGNDGFFKYDSSTDDFTQIKQNTRLTMSGIYGNYSIKEDDQNNLWILRHVHNDPVYHLDQFNIKTGSYRKFTTGTVAANTIPVHVIGSLLIDKAGKLWINTDNGIYTFDTLSKTFKGYFTSTDSNANTAFNPMYEAPSQPGILWMNVGNSKKDIWQGLLRFDIKTGNVKQYRHNVSDPSSIASDSFSVIIEDNKTQNLWIGTDKGLSEFDLKTERFNNYIPTDIGKGSNINRIYRIEEDSQGALWMANNNRLLFFDPHKEIFTKFIPDELTPDGLPDNPVNVIFIDKTYNVWLAFQNRFGLQRIKQQNLQFTQYKNIPGNAESYPGGGVNNFILAKDSTYFMATAKGLYNWNRNTNQFKKIHLFTNSTEDGESINKIQLGKNGMIWGLKNHNDIFSYNIKTGAAKTYQYKEGDSNSLSGDFIYTMFEDTEGTIWAGTKPKILDKLAGKTQTFTHLHFDSNGGFVQAFFEDSKGLLWIGTSEGALYCLNPVTGKFTSYPDPEKVDEAINDIIEDKNGRIWCATFNGIFLFDKNTGKRRIFREKDGLQYHFAGNIIEDKEGYLWITSERGLSRLNPDNFTFSNFTSLQGLPEGLSFSGWTKPFLTGDGELMIGNKTGFFTFFPLSIVPNHVPPFIHIDAIIYTDSRSTGNEKEDTILPDKNYKEELPYNKNRITFNYTGIHFSNAALNQYTYKLKGYNDNWVQAGTQRTVTYNNLPPGTYTFFVKSSNSDGVWNKEPVSFTIIINPPWWRTWWAYLIYVVCFIMIAFYANRTIRNRIVEKERMRSREKELEQAKEIEKAYHELKSTQAQLIQSEKMASLGELTAGIAHEIQNPLNFVNNFSEVNREMIAEMKDEIDKGNYDEVRIIADDIEANEQKINHHGKRADSIVKGMLQHSKASTGKKEPTDINALCDEYLRLSYHGMRAKDKSFNAEIKTDFDEGIGTINVVPQDIGRVLLNLFNNAFYATNQKQKDLTGFTNLSGQQSYVPTVTIVTKKLKDGVEIIVKDNGNGIPQNIVDKIFQPFFTTKPTGQGTGLGLSLSYDIIKAHGGEIKVETKSEEGSTFIIQLPIG